VAGRRDSSYRASFSTSRFRTGTPAETSATTMRCIQVRQRPWHHGRAIHRGIWGTRTDREGATGIHRPRTQVYKIYLRSEIYKPRRPATRRCRPRFARRKASPAAAGATSGNGAGRAAGSTGSCCPRTAAGRGGAGAPPSRAHQRRRRSSGAFHILSPGLVPKASWKASALIVAPIARNWPGECGSVVASCSARSSRVLVRHTCAKP